MVGSLYLQSVYSILNSTLTLERIFELAKMNKHDFVCLVDNKLHGLYKATKLANKYQTKLIIGLEVSLPTLKLKVILIAKTDEGLNNLIRLTTMIETSEQELRLADLKQSGVEIIIPVFNNILEEYLLTDYSRAEQFIKTIQSELVKFHLGMSLQSTILKEGVADELVKLAASHQLLILPIHKINYEDIESKEAYLSLKTISSGERPKSNLDLSFPPREEILTKFQDFPQVINNLTRFIKRVTYNQKLKTYKLPKYPITNETSFEYLKNLAHRGLQKRLKSQSNQIQYLTRLEYELEMIKKMGFEDYFLIVYDFIRYAKENQIRVGPGRGSAAGSLVSFCIGITEVDPIKYNLLFERFLNPARSSPPDIDTDFPDDRRDEVIQYVANKYGKERVASITTYTTFALKSSIRDIAKVLKVDANRVNGIIKRIIDDNPDLKDQETVKLLKITKQIQGLPRQTSTHPAGIILSDESLTKTIPLQKGAHELYQTQYDQGDLEELGLLKIDFLGLRNLAVVDRILNSLSQKISLNELPLDDQNTFKLLRKAQTSGIFQLESLGIRTALKKIAPTEFEDIVALLALYRPGPMDSIDLYVSRKLGRATYNHLDPLVEEILKPTYGIIVYQEQIMMIAQKFAGYSLSEADLLRRGISDKDKGLLNQEEDNFIKRAVANNQNAETAKSIYQYILKFADYGFNRSHSVAYSLLSYQMAYLKANYYPIFMTVLMGYSLSNETLLKEYLTESKENGLIFIQPNIKYATDQFIIGKQAIMLPLTMIKGISPAIVSQIVVERNKAEFHDYDDFKNRVKKIINEKQLISLIYSGALDSFKLSRATMYEQRDLTHSGLKDFLDDYELKDIEEYDFAKLVEQEREIYGFNLFYSPLMKYNGIREKERLQSIVAQQTLNNQTFLAQILTVKEIKTKIGDKMCFLLVSDEQTETEITVFPQEYKIYQSNLKPNEIFIFNVNLNRQQSLILNEIKKIN